MFGRTCKVCEEKDKAIALLREEIAHLRDLTRPRPVNNNYYPLVDQERDLVDSIRDDQSVRPLSEEEREQQNEAIRILTGTYS